jgi:hypothetical protein
MASAVILFTATSSKPGPELAEVQSVDDSVAKRLSNVIKNGWTRARAKPAAFRVRRAGMGLP